MELIETLKKEQVVEQLCKKHSLNIALLEPIFDGWLRGLNNNKVAQKIGVHRITVQRYATALKDVPEQEFHLIKEYILQRMLEDNQEK